MSTSTRITVVVALLSVAALTTACEPSYAGLDDGDLYRSVTVVERDGQMIAGASFHVDESTPLDCARFSDDIRAAIGNDRLELTSVGGLLSNADCTPGHAQGVLSQATVDGPATLTLVEGTTTHTMPLWDRLERKRATLVDPSAGLLKEGIPFVLRWPHTIHGIQLDIEIIDQRARPTVEIIAVEGYEMTAVYEATPYEFPDPSAQPPILRVTVRQHHVADCRPRNCSWQESWQTDIPVTLELAPRTD